MPSGAAVLTVAPGRGDQALSRTDGAMVNFTIWDADGKAINSSIAEGRPTLFPMAKVMPAFADCLQGMKVGEKRHCWIPAERNEGFPGAQTGALVFELQLDLHHRLRQADAGQAGAARARPAPERPARRRPRAAARAV